MATRLCPQNHRVTDDSATFCPQCGQALPMPPPAPATETPEQRKARILRNNRFYIVCGIAFLALVMPGFLRSIWPDRSSAVPGRPTAPATAQTAWTATPVPLPTPRRALSAVTAEAIRLQWDDLTDIQRAAYERQLAGQYVRWSATVAGVSECGTVSALVSLPAVFKSVSVAFRIPIEEALRIGKDQGIVFEGEISGIEPSPFFVITLQDVLIYE